MAVIHDVSSIASTLITSIIRIFLHPTTSSTDDLIVFLAKLIPLIGVAKLFIQGETGELPDNDIGHFSHRWAEFMVLCIYLVARRDGLHSAAAQFLAINAVIPSFGLMAAVSKQCATFHSDRTLPGRVIDAVRAVLTAAIVFLFLRLEVYLIPHGWSAIQDHDTTATFVSTICGIFVVYLILMCIHFIMAASPPSWKINGLGLAGRILLLLRYIIEMLFIVYPLHIMTSTVSEDLIGSVISSSFILMGVYVVCLILEKLLRMLPAFGQSSQIGSSKDGSLKMPAKN